LSLPMPVRPGVHGKHPRVSASEAMCSPSQIVVSDSGVPASSHAGNKSDDRVVTIEFSCQPQRDSSSIRLEVEGRLVELA
jgi:hypothetical protein